MLSPATINSFYSSRVLQRKSIISQTIKEVCRITQEILKEVESQEPRFISTLHENNGHFEGLHVISPTEFEIILYLNQMGVFNFVDDGSLPGCAVLKLSDGRKRSMSLWVEFITASGYLSARKIRSRFQTLVAGAVDRTPYRDCVKMIADTSEVKLRIKEQFVVQITTAFRCAGIWPRSASQWPTHASNSIWPLSQTIGEVKSEGFDLLSKEPPLSSIAPKQQQSLEGDAFVMSFLGAEDILLGMDYRRRLFSVLKTIKDMYFDTLLPPRHPVTTYLLKTLVLFECEKHAKWDDSNQHDRVVGVLLQLVSCLQCRKCPHYFIQSVDLVKHTEPTLLDQTTKLAWNLMRNLIINPRCLESLGYDNSSVL